MKILLLSTEKALTFESNSTYTQACQRFYQSVFNQIFHITKNPETLNKHNFCLHCLQGIKSFSN